MILHFLIELLIRPHKGLWGLCYYCKVTANSLQSIGLHNVGLMT